MNKSLSARRMTENEAVFRKYNERVKQAFDRHKQIAKEEGQSGLIHEDSAPIHFFCECSDENCRQRIKIKPSRYTAIHKRRDYFIVVCGHEENSIEHVVDETDEFCIVEKYVTPPETTTVLHKTPRKTR